MAKVTRRVYRAGESKPRVLTPAEVESLVNRVKVGLRERRATCRREEPGLTEEARHFVIRY